MAFILVESNRYIGEHSCGIHHFGNMALVRACCVEDCRKYAEMAQRNALTTAHTAYRLYREAWNGLTDAEMALVPNFTISGADSSVIDLRLCDPNT